MSVANQSNEIPVWGRPTVYKGIRMRSRLEAKWAADFDSDASESDCWLQGWDYEPCAFADEVDQYLPDFRLHFKAEGTEWVEYREVKGALADPISVMERMEIILRSEPRAHLSITTGPPDDPSHWWETVPEEDLLGRTWLVWHDALDYGGRYVTACKARLLG